MRGPQALVETDPRVYPRPLGWWSKSVGGNTTAMKDKGLKMTRMQCRLEEKGWSYMCWRVSTIMIETMSWKICEGRLGS